MSTQHKYIPSSEAHEPKGIESAEPGSVYTADGTGTGVWINPAPTTTTTTVISSSTYDIVLADVHLNVTYTSTGVVTITLKSDQVVDTRVVTIKDAGGNAGTNNITIDTEGSETIDGAATAVINSDYSAINLYCDGTNWSIT